MHKCYTDNEVKIMELRVEILAHFLSQENAQIVFPELDRCSCPSCRAGASVHRSLRQNGSQPTAILAAVSDPWTLPRASSEAGLHCCVPLSGNIRQQALLLLSPQSLGFAGAPCVRSQCYPPFGRAALSRPSGL